MGFWTHSFASRRQRDYDVIEAPQREHAMVALAGWTISGGPAIWHVYDRDGNYHGHNLSERGAVQYALQEINSPWDGSEDVPQVARSIMRRGYGAAQHGQLRLNNNYPVTDASGRSR